MGHSGTFINRAAVLSFLILSAAVFTLYAPLAYGTPWTRAECNRVKLFPTWDFDCPTFLDDYESYKSLSLTEVPSDPVVAAPSPQPVVNIPVADMDQKPLAMEAKNIISQVSLPLQPKIIAKEERIEYRDQDGNLLDAEQIKSLEGSVEFKTKYETKTRVIDEQGQEIPMPANGWPNDLVGGVAPPHPDVEGVDKETVSIKNAEIPRDAAASRDGEKEAEQSKARPASEGREATVQEEL